MVSVPEDAGWYLDEYDAERFWSYVSYRGGTDHESDPLASATGECWVWATVREGDYAKFLWKFGRWESAHRVAYKDFGHKIPEGFEVDHLCRNPRCVKPTHLEAVTRDVNVQRGLAANHSGKCPKDHDLTPENTRIQMSRGKERKVCATCDKARKRNNYQRKSVAKLS